MNRRIITPYFIVGSALALVLTSCHNNPTLIESNPPHPQQPKIELPAVVGLRPHGEQQESVKVPPQPLGAPKDIPSIYHYPAPGSDIIRA